MDIFSVTNKQAAQPSIKTNTDTKDVKRMVAASNNINKAMPHATNADKTLKPSKEELKDTIEHLNKHMDSLETNIKFGFDGKVEQMFVNVTERSTGKVIRRIPTEEAMKISEKMKEIVGMIFDKKG